MQLSLMVPHKEIQSMNAVDVELEEEVLAFFFVGSVGIVGGACVGGSCVGDWLLQSEGPGRVLVGSDRGDLKLQSEVLVLL